VSSIFSNALHLVSKGREVEEVERGSLWTCVKRHHMPMFALERLSTWFDYLFKFHVSNKNTLLVLFRLIAIRRKFVLQHQKTVLIYKSGVAIVRCPQLSRCKQNPTTEAAVNCTWPSRSQQYFRMRNGIRFELQQCCETGAPKLWDCGIVGVRHIWQRPPRGITLSLARQIRHSISRIN
jgi:hypothetical protein